MYALIPTITFLTILTIVTTSRLEQARSHFTLDHHISEHLNANRETANQYQRQLYEAAVASSDSGDQRETAFNDEFPSTQVTARLNLYPMLTRGDSPQKELYWETFKRLVDHLYSSSPFALDLPNVLDCVRKALEANQAQDPSSKTCRPQRVELPRLDLKDPQMQKIWANMLRGRSRQYPSLLEYVCISDQRGDLKINLAFAPPELLAAVLQDDQVVATVLTKRAKLLASLEAPGSDREKRQDARSELETVVTTGTGAAILDAYAGHLDYSFAYFPSTFCVAAGDQVRVQKFFNGSRQEVSRLGLAVEANK